MMKHLLALIFLFIFSFYGNAHNSSSQKIVVCTAADQANFSELSSLIGSIHKINYTDLECIVVFDLGMSWDQRQLLEHMQKVKLCSVELTHPNLLKHVYCGSYYLCGGKYGKVVRGWNAWRPVIIKQTTQLYDHFLYMDPGCVVLKSLTHLSQQTQKSGYFFIQETQIINNQQTLIKDFCTDTIVNFFGFHDPKFAWMINMPLINPALQGISTKLLHDYTLPLYELTKELHIFQDNGTGIHGFGFAGHDVVICSTLVHFLHLNIYKKSSDNKMCFKLTNVIQLPNPHSENKEDLSSNIMYKDERINGKTAKELLNKIIPEKEKKIIIIIPSYNNKDWYIRNLDSIFSQKYTNFEIVYIDDNSADGTALYVENYIQSKKSSVPIKLIKNTHRLGALANLYAAIHACDDSSIIAFVDGDDWLASDVVLSRINKAYQDPDIWLTYGQFKRYPSDEKGYCEYYPSEVIENGTFRDYYFVAGHLRTCYAWLLKKIKREDLTRDGIFFPMTYDQALSYPVLEMAGNHICFIPEVLYIYNRANALNDDKVNNTLQWECECICRTLPRYDKL